MAGGVARAAPARSGWQGSAGAARALPPTTGIDNRVYRSPRALAGPFPSRARERFTYGPAAGRLARSSRSNRETLNVSIDGPSCRPLRARVPQRRRRDGRCEDRDADLPAWPPSAVRLRPGHVPAAAAELETACRACDGSSPAWLTVCRTKNRTHRKRALPRLVQETLAGLRHVLLLARYRYPEAGQRVCRRSRVQRTGPGTHSGSVGRPWSTLRVACKVSDVVRAFALRTCSSPRKRSKALAVPM